MKAYSSKVYGRKKQMEYKSTTNNENEIRGKERENGYNERNEANKKLNIKRNK
jgi:hypothetical protein